MLNDKVYTYVFRIINQETAMLITKYPDSIDETVVNNLYSDLLIEAGDNNSQAFINYLTKLISFSEQKEDYKRCSKLLKLKNKLKEYENE